MVLLCVWIFFFEWSCNHRELHVLTHSFPTRRASALYALGVGCGHEPLDPGDLRHVYEDGLLALPTMAVVLGYPGFWLKDPETGVDWRRVLHGEQGQIGRAHV